MEHGERTRPVPGFSPEFLARYSIQQVLGSGGMSVVYRGTQLGLRRPVAIKVLDAVAFAEEEARSRFGEEARIAARLDHPNIVRLYEYGQDRELRYLVYELVEGVDLAKRISMGGSGVRKGLPLEEAMGILRDVARGLEYAHKLDVVHRDLKPANILVGADGTAKLGDFGLGRIMGHAREISTATGVVVGTPECMAPEQAKAGTIGPPADVYALGILAWWMLAGHPPFEADSVAEILQAHLEAKVPDLAKERPNLPPGVYEVVSRLLEKNPGHRPSATDLIRALKVADRWGDAAIDQVNSALSSSRMRIVPVVPGPGKALGPALGLIGLVLLGFAAWPRAKPHDPQGFASPTRARFEWRGAADRVLVRPKDGSRGWVDAEGESLGEAWHAVVGGLAAGEDYEWRLASEAPEVLRVLRTPVPARVDGPWPVYDARGEARGWLIKAEDGAAVAATDGSKPEERSDGLGALGPTGFQILYPGGLAERGSAPSSLPGFEEARLAFVGALGALDPRRVLGAARARKEGEVPTLAARRACLAEYARWKGLEPALRGRIDALDPDGRLALYLVLGKAEAIDRALRAENLAPVFEVGPALADCLAVACEERAVPTREGGFEIVTAAEQRNVATWHNAVPPRLAVPAGSGPLRLTMEVSGLASFAYLELELGSRRIPIRPSSRDFVFRGEVRVRLPPELVGGADFVRLHVKWEDLPGRGEGDERPKLPLFGAGPAPELPVAARLEGWTASR